jgi:hypothetical protein
MKGAFDPTAASLRLQALQKQQALDVAAQPTAVTQRQALQQDLTSTETASPSATVKGVTATNGSSTAAAAQVRKSITSTDYPSLQYIYIMHFDAYFGKEQYVDTGVSALSAAAFTVDARRVMCTSVHRSMIVNSIVL